ncbi:hypothetical protein TrispH2_003295 [Trichoplax sp. H2]|uniref:Uncharacterized protein n=1 Tax=Trichoplax adhaerens TaxID=10228 RepID=B3RYU2_TRIAD|nr:hypothetical protein TRIADDRAFT_57216 [Trichoplax adhaerens]EDV24086.1 hypothetical protein TRIADDRAFT_57216 [Trichoplax adhaerens]RDD44268.1 hypothetical protein TrispH2_003295 [Trichoplax sp. H2]|eukprot:XP_002113612.1 hypothetical protein TRIADDRAFT_57216 [Trichoplax adhaerens]
MTSSTGFRFTVKIDIVLLRKTLEMDPFRMARGFMMPIWQEIADHVSNSCKIAVDHHKCRIRIANLVTYGKRKTDSKYRRLSGSTTDHRERDMLVQKLLELKRLSEKNKLPYSHSKQLRSRDSLNTSTTDITNIPNDGNAPESSESEISVDGDTESRLNDNNRLELSTGPDLKNLQSQLTDIVTELKLARKEISLKQDFLIKLKEREIEVQQIKLEMKQELLSANNRHEPLNVLTDLIKLLREEVSIMREDRVKLMSMVIKGFNK